MLWASSVTNHVTGIQSACFLWSATNFQLSGTSMRPQNYPRSWSDLSNDQGLVRRICPSQVFGMLRGLGVDLLVVLIDTDREVRQMKMKRKHPAKCNSRIPRHTGAFKDRSNIWVH